MFEENIEDMMLRQCITYLQPCYCRLNVKRKCIDSSMHYTVDTTTRWDETSMKCINILLNFYRYTQLINEQTLRVYIFFYVFYFTKGWKQ